jgi:hypothetical protein
LVSLLVFADSEGNIQAGDGNAFLIAELCIFNCRFMYFYYAENNQYSCGYEITYDKVGDVIKAYGDDIHKLYKLYFSDMFSTYFRSERDFKSGMLSFYQLLGNNQESR